MFGGDEVNERAWRLLAFGQRWAGTGAYKPKAAHSASGGSSVEPKKARGVKKIFVLDFSKRHEATSSLPQPSPKGASPQFGCTRV